MILVQYFLLKGFTPCILQKNLVVLFGWRKEEGKEDERPSVTESQIKAPFKSIYRHPFQSLNFGLLI